MRDRAPVLFPEHESLIIATAKELQEYQPPEDCLFNPYRKLALERLASFRQALQQEPFRLQKPDMLAVTDVLMQMLSPYDPEWRDGHLNTDNGNASVILQMGTIIASLLGNQYITYLVEQQNQEIAGYLKDVYDLYAIDPGDPEIMTISHAFVVQHPAIARQVMPMLTKLTETLVEEIHTIPQRQNYLARHMFLTGCVEYPGIGYEIEVIRNAQGEGAAVHTR